MGNYLNVFFSLTLGDPWELRRPAHLLSSHGKEEWEAVMEMAKEDARRFPVPSNMFQVLLSMLILKCCFREIPVQEALISCRLASSEATTVLKL